MKTSNTLPDSEYTLFTLVIIFKHLNTGHSTCVDVWLHVSQREVLLNFRGRLENTSVISVDDHMWFYAEERIYFTLMHKNSLRNSSVQDNFEIPFHYSKTRTLCSASAVKIRIWTKKHLRKIYTVRSLSCTSNVIFFFHVRYWSASQIQVGFMELKRLTPVPKWWWRRGEHESSRISLDWRKDSEKGTDRRERGREARRFNRGCRNTRCSKTRRVQRTRENEIRRRHAENLMIWKLRGSRQRFQTWRSQLLWRTGSDFTWDMSVRSK